MKGIDYCNAYMARTRLSAVADADCSCGAAAVDIKQNVRNAEARLVGLTAAPGPWQVVSAKGHVRVMAGGQIVCTVPTGGEMSSEIERELRLTLRMLELVPETLQCLAALRDAVEEAEGGHDGSECAYGGCPLCEARRLVGRLEVPHSVEFIGENRAEVGK
jgi:hypothetical protein